MERGREGNPRKAADGSHFHGSCQFRCTAKPRSQVFMSMSLTSCSRWVQRCRVGRARGRSEHTSARLLGMVARAPRFTRGASGGELCAAYSHLRAVGWGLVHPKVGALYSFSFDGRKFSHRPIQQTSLRLHRNGEARSEASNFSRQDHLAAAEALLSQIKRLLLGRFTRFGYRGLP